MKILFYTIFILIIVILILIIVIKSINAKYKKLNDNYENLKRDIESINNTCNILKEEKEIEIKQKNELAKKLADISRMSIDDVLHQLQNN